ncbi:MAG: divergent polysaccharide deacetylase family protein [Alphaproteobacteria bacterium]|nr:divergent polysaccharide deacetylase family protein [Alphaproteobacteria bacterium]
MPPAAGKGLSGLAVTSIALAVFACAVVAWLQFSGPPAGPKPGPAVVVQLNPPPKPKPPPPEQPAASTPAAPDAPAKVPDVPAPATPPEGTAERPAPAPAPPTVPPELPAPAQPPAAAAPDTPPGPAPGTAELPGDLPAPSSEPAAPPTQTAKIPAAVSGGLRPAPDPALVEKTRLGPLPRVSPDGRKPWQTYARPFDPGDRRPRIAIIVSGLGLSGAATEAAIQRLPGAVTLAFAPYSKGLPQWIALARAAGHEVLLDLPMEPVNFPANDPGPHTLLTSLTADQNRERLHWLLGRVTGYVGVVNRMGSRFTTSATHVRPVLKELEKRGLLFVDSRSSLRSIAAQMAREVGLPRAVNNRFIDGEASRDAIDSRLNEIERIAKASGYAVGIGAPFPVTIDRLVRWAQTLERKKLVLAPISALVNTQTN